MPPSQPPRVPTGARPPPPRRAGAHGGNGGATKKRGRENEAGKGKEAGGGDAARIYAEVNSGAQQDVMRAAAPARGSGGGASSDPLAGVEARITALLASGGRKAGGAGGIYSVPRMEVLLEVPGGKKRAGKDVVRRGGSVAEAGGREAGKRSRQRSRAGGVERLVWELKARPDLAVCASTIHVSALSPSLPQFSHTHLFSPPPCPPASPAWHPWWQHGATMLLPCAALLLLRTQGRPPLLPPPLSECACGQAGRRAQSLPAPLAWFSHRPTPCAHSPSTCLHCPLSPTPLHTVHHALLFFVFPYPFPSSCVPLRFPACAPSPRRMCAWVAAMDLHGAMLTGETEEGKGGKGRGWGGLMGRTHRAGLQQAHGKQQVLTSAFNRSLQGASCAHALACAMGTPFDATHTPEPAFMVQPAHTHTLGKMLMLTALGQMVMLTALGQMVMLTALGQMVMLTALACSTGVLVGGVESELLFSQQLTSGDAVAMNYKGLLVAVFYGAPSRVERASSSRKEAAHRSAMPCNIVHPSHSPHSPLSLPSLTSLYPLNPPSAPPPAGGMSVAAVFVNKAIFRVYRFTFPYTLVFFQTLFTLLLLAAMRLSRAIRLAPFRLSVLRRVRPSPCLRRLTGMGRELGVVGSRGCPAMSPCHRPTSHPSPHLTSPHPSHLSLPPPSLQVALLSFAFLLKLLLDMAALSRVNIPMYGVLKSATTPCVLLLDYLLRAKRASLRVQLSVYMTALGGVIAGAGDLTFDLPGYVLALSSALATAAYVVIVGKLGEELQLDSFTLLLYNNCWSLPFSFLLLALNGELPAVQRVLQSRDAMFLTCFVLSCASAFVLNLATYLCTLVNDTLTTSIVGLCPAPSPALPALRAYSRLLPHLFLPTRAMSIRTSCSAASHLTPYLSPHGPGCMHAGRTKSILQGLGGLFAFGDVLVSALPRPMPLPSYCVPPPTALPTPLHAPTSSHLMPHLLHLFHPPLPSALYTLHFSSPYSHPLPNPLPLNSPPIPPTDECNERGGAGGEQRGHRVVCGGEVSRGTAPLTPHAVTGACQGWQGHHHPRRLPGALPWRGEGRGGEGEGVWCTEVGALTLTSLRIFPFSPTFLYMHHHHHHHAHQLSLVFNEVKTEDADQPDPRNGSV
ncbi:unnamed protein product [Closterium sp. NIES-54]